MRFNYKKTIHPALTNVENLAGKNTKKTSLQHKVDTQSLAFSHHKAVVYPWECWNEFLVARCPS